MSAPGERQGGQVRTGSSGADWQRQPDRHCELCGRLLIVAHVVVGGRVFCNGECAELYESYWLPRQAHAAPGG